MTDDYPPLWVIWLTELMVWVSALGIVFASSGGLLLLAFGENTLSRWFAVVTCAGASAMFVVLIKSFRSDLKEWNEQTTTEKKDEEPPVADIS